MTVQKDRRFRDVMLGVLAGVFGTLAFDNLVNLLAGAGMTKFRFILLVLFAGFAIWCVMKALRKV